MAFFQAMLAFLFIFFIPGFLITLNLFRKSDWLEKITLSILFSIGFYVILGIVLGFNVTSKNITGGLTASNLWRYTIIFSVLLLGIFIARNRKALQNRISKHAKKIKNK